MPGTDVREYLRIRKEQVDRALDELMPPEDMYPQLIHRAMRYSLFAGGKRLRPLLHLAAVETCGGDPQSCMPFACALEMIHTYSLIHDDLPAMDDDDFRRGKPTNHKVFGEAVAILAGDALLTEAFRVVSDERTRRNLDPQALLWATFELAHAAGSQGMVGGQTMDVVTEGKDFDPDLLEYIHTRKTAALMRAAILTGAILSGAPNGKIRLLGRFGWKLGLAFQIRDDLLNVEGDERRLGKAVGTDAARGKATYPALYGLERARIRQDELVGEALGILSPLDHLADPLREITKYIAARDA